MAVLACPFDLPQGRLLALDLGQARHGVAVSDASGNIATPMTALARARTREADFAAIARIVAAEKVAGVLVGRPDSGGEERGAMARWATRYGGRLAGHLPVPVAFWDETLTSSDAASLLAETGSRRSIDAAAAALLLQDFLDRRREAARESVGSSCDGAVPLIGGLA